MWDLIAGVFLQLNPFLQLIIILGALFLYNTGTITLPRIIKNKLNKKKVKNHNECSLYPDHLEMLAKERSKAERIMEIKYINTVYDQMNLVETTGDKIGSLLTDKFHELVEARNTTDKKASDAIQIYDLIIDGAMDDCRGYLRKWVKLNHLAERTEVEFQMYIHQRSDELQKHLKKYIDKKYLKTQLIIDRKELYEENLRIFYEKVLVLLSDMFIGIRAIAEESARKIAEIEKETI
jgi:hypothetical protein